MRPSPRLAVLLGLLTIAIDALAGGCGKKQSAVATPPLETPTPAVSGSAFLAAVTALRSDLRLLTGYDLVERFTAPILKEPPPSRSIFCRRCGSPVSDPDGDGDRFEIAAGLLEGDPGVSPDKHIIVEVRSSWFRIDDTLPHFTEAEFIALRGSQSHE